MTQHKEISSTRRRGLRRATEILELALLLPLLLGLVFGTIEFGYYFFLQHNVQGAAEGARTGIVFNSTQADANAKVTAFLSQAGLNPSKFTITFYPPDVSTVEPGHDIIVTVEGSWSTVGIRTLRLISSNKIVRGKAVMRKEG